MPMEGISRERFIRQVLLDVNFRKEGSILAIDGEEPIGYCLAVARQAPVEGTISDPERGYLWLFGVVPEARKRGVGTELLRRAEAFVRSHERSAVLVSPYSPGYFAPGVDVSAYATGLEFLKARGYGEVYRPLAMETSLWNLVSPEWIAGVEVTLCRDGSQMLDRLLTFARGEFGPDWARYVRESLLRQLDGDRRTGLSVATVEDEVVGFGHFDGERFGPIGTAPKVRGKGIGQVLMWDVLAQQRERGYRCSWFLWSDDRTAEKLYHNAGFKEVRRFAVLKKELS